jgi:hypothetical protein
MGDRNRMWVKRAESKYAESSDNLNGAHSLKLGKQQSTENVISNPNTNGVAGVDSGSVQRKVAGTEVTGAFSGTTTGKRFESADVRTDLVAQACNLETPEMSPVGSDVNQENKGPDLVQKKGMLRPSSQNRKDIISHKKNGKDIRSHAGHAVARNGLKHGCLDNIAAKSTSMHDDLGPDGHARPEIQVVRPSTNRSAGVYADRYARGCKSFETNVPSNQRRIFSVREFMPMTSVHQYRPRVFGGSKNFEVGGPSKNQRNVFLPKYREFRPKAAFQHYELRNSVGRKIMSVPDLTSTRQASHILKKDARSVR